MAVSKGKITMQKYVQLFQLTSIFTARRLIFANITVYVFFISIIYVVKKASWYIEINFSSLLKEQLQQIIGENFNPMYDILKKKIIAF